jgi:hypothetical protein
MTYIIGSLVSAPIGVQRFASMGFNAGVPHRINSIRLNKATQKVEYRFNSGKMLEFDSVADAESLFDRIMGVTRQKSPETPTEEII